MPKIKVVIEETLSKVFEIEADSKESAMEIVKNNYDHADEDYVLSASDWEKQKFFVGSYLWF